MTVSFPVRWIVAAALLVAVTSLAESGAGGTASGSWAVDRNGQRRCTPMAVFPNGVSYVNVCARRADGSWRPIWSGQAVLTELYTTTSRPAPVGQVDFSKLQVEVKKWSAGSGVIYVSGEIVYVAPWPKPGLSTSFGCKTCNGGRSTWWTEDDGAHWYFSKHPRRACRSEAGHWRQWGLHPPWPAYRARACTSL